MNRWPTKPLGKVCELVNGRPFKPNEWEEAGLPIIRIQNLNDPTKPFNYTTLVLPEKFKVKRRDTLLSWSGTPGTSFGCFRWDGPEGWLNQHIFNVHLSDEVLPPFFIYQVNSKLEELIAKAHGGVGLQHITKGALSSVNVTVPPLAEQERIVKLLDEADELRKLRAQADRRASTLIPSLFHEMFGDPATNDRKWKREVFSNLLDGIDGGWSPTCHDRPIEAGEWGVLKLGAVTTCKYIDTENKALPESFAPRPELEVKVGDLLFTRKNTYELVAACAVVFETRPKLMLSDLIFRFRLKPGVELDPVYLWGLLTVPGKRRQVQVLAGGSAGSMPNISKGRLLTLPIEVPPFPLQKEFAARVTDIRAMESEQAASRRRLENLFQSMLHRAFNGSL
ncbi:MAG: restriction endonuclease subunit S [Nitrospirae bacterium]|nr:restriction endonuclease subunit S [Nitrospirota bacterium]